MVSLSLADVLVTKQNALLLFHGKHWFCIKDSWVKDVWNPNECAIIPLTSETFGKMLDFLFWIRWICSVNRPGITDLLGYLCRGHVSAQSPLNNTFKALHSGINECICCASIHLLVTGAGPMVRPVRDHSPAANSQHWVFHNPTAWN